MTVEISKPSAKFDMGELRSHLEEDGEYTAPEVETIVGGFFITACWLLDLQAVVSSILIGFFLAATLLGLSFQLYTRDILLGVKFYTFQDLRLVL